MAERVLVTGGAGFLGRAVSARARAAGPDVITVGRTGPPSATHRIVDLAADPRALAALLDDIQPSLVLHLAGGTRGDPFEANVAPLRGLLDALERRGARPRVIVAGSAAELGDAGPGPIREDARELPLTEYGIAKLAQTRLALAAQRRGLRVTVARVFNVIGPGMSEALAPARLARAALAARERGERRIETGPLDPVRDFLDADEVARVLWELGGAALAPELVHVCSGTGTSVRALLAEILRQVGLVATVQERQDLRGAGGGIPVSIGDCALLERTIGRRPSFDLRGSVARLLASLRDDAAPVPP